MVRLLFLLLLWIAPLAAVPLPVAVSVLPQKALAKGVGGDAVTVQVVVAHGYDPALYQPTPRQLARLARARLYVRAGVPFESSWLPRFRSLNPHMTVLDLRRDLPLIQTPEGGDPHVWTDPSLMITHVRLLADTLGRLDPGRAAAYRQGAGALAGRLQALDAELARTLAPVRGRTFLVYHPAWSYFARRYGLRQLAVEQEGKPPNARALARLAAQVRALGLDTLIVPPQHRGTAVRALARTLGLRIVEVDPLAEDYFGSLRRMARVVAEAAR